MRRIVAFVAAVLLMCAAGSFAQEKKKKGEETTRSVAGAVTAPTTAPWLARSCS